MITLLFFSIFLLLLSIKNFEYIIICILLFNLIAFKEIKYINKKIIKAIFFFNTGVSLGYIVFSYFEKISPWNYIIYINLKVYMMTFFVFYFFKKISIIKVLGFNKEFSYLLTITLSQIFSYRKTFIDFRDAFKSRVVNIRDKEKQFIINTFKFFLNKAMRDSKERALAMKARGFFEN